jgi:hypothetical protein
MSRSSRCSLHQEEFANNPECLIPAVKHMEGSVMVWAAISWYSVGHIVIFHGGITAREYMDRLGNQVHPMIQMLFPNKDAVLQDDSASIHTAGTVQSWFEENEGEHDPWPAQSAHLNNIETLLVSFGD